MYLLHFHPKPLPIYKPIYKQSEEFLSILLIHMFVISLHFTHPAEQAFGREVFFCYSQILGK
jgi:hypothetical protein